jgi:hypothetical protein
MQSWPARQFKNGGFYVPDTFSRDAVTEPATVQRFQEFNLRIARENYYSCDGPLHPLDIVAVGYGLVRHGLSWYSAVHLLRQLALERIDVRHKAARPVMQVLPCFDLFWELHRRVRPQLSIFFTKHVAAMMHRYWGDAMPGYEVVNPRYKSDPIFATFIWRAMDAVDRHLGAICTHMTRRPSATLLVASSMGQHAVFDSRSPRRFVLENPQALAHALALGSTQPGAAMYPMSSLALLEGQCAEEAAAAIGSVTVKDGSPLFRDVTASGSTVQFGVAFELDVAANNGAVRMVPLGSTTPLTAPMRSIGMTVRGRLGGSNTAQHVPEGIAIGTSPRESRSHTEDGSLLTTVADRSTFWTWPPPFWPTCSA